MSFESFKLDPLVLLGATEAGFEVPTPIQKLAIPPIMEGKDVLAAAATGSGKTAAFLLPILNHLVDMPKGSTRALILTPTRELAAQIVDHARKLGHHAKIKAAPVIGGVGMEPQAKALRSGTEIIVSTPGRLLDHLQYDYVSFDGLKFLVLDEADRMLDMGFLPDVTRILDRLPRDRQSLLFSATLPEPIVDLAHKMLKKPVKLNIDRKSSPAHGITHTIYPVPKPLKSYLLFELLKRQDHPSILVFTRTKHRANRLADFLLKRRVSATRIHGDRTQSQRTEALAGFKEGKFRVLVATDLAARGLDVVALGMVVNFDVPGQVDDYIHRVGRTARAGETGDAITFVCPEEESDLSAIERHLDTHLTRETLQGFNYAFRPDDGYDPGTAAAEGAIPVIRTRRTEERRREESGEPRPPRPPRQDQQRSRFAPPLRPEGDPHGHGGPHMHPTGSEGATLEKPPTIIRRPRPWERKGPSLKGVEDKDNRGNRVDSSSRPARPPHVASGRREEFPKRPAESDRPWRNAPAKPQPSADQESLPSDRTGGFSFIRSSRFVEGSPLGSTAGVREDTARSRRHEEGGRSHWAKALQEKTKTGWKPSEADPEE